MQEREKSGSLPFYYRERFPHELFHAWLNCSACPEHPDPSSPFARRELSLPTEGTFTRYQFFDTAEALREHLLRQPPERLDIGPIYHSRFRLRPVEKELVFDVDLSDYDDFRQCCKGAAMCQKCFRFAEIAVRVLQDVFAHEFGWRHVLWVFSGRRGVHAWVGDRDVRALGSELREAIVAHLRPAWANGRLVLRGGRLHPMHERVFQRFLFPFFEETVLGEHKVMEGDSIEKCLSYLPPSASGRLRTEFSLFPSSPTHKWARFKWEAERCAKEDDMHNPLYSLVFDFCFPKLDTNVSRSIIHLLKAPFSIHPETRLVCVPFDAERVGEFRVDQVPTPESLMKERWSMGGEVSSLQQYVEVFAKHVEGLLRHFGRENGEHSRKRKGPEDTD